MDKQNESIARAVIIRDSRVLLVHRKGGDNTFLPGGHIEDGETAAAALARELNEELGMHTGKVGRFLGVVEHRYLQGGTEVTEINLLFAADAGPLRTDAGPAACESHLEFTWAACTRAELTARVLEPSILRDHLPVLVRGGTLPPYLTTIGENEDVSDPGIDGTCRTPEG